MGTPYKKPTFRENAFNCPHCCAYSKQKWEVLAHHIQSAHYNFINELQRAVCSNPDCQKYSVWVGETMVYPDESGVELPNPDLNQEIQDDYLEARTIVNRSPRGAAALLRLCIQKLCGQLGERGKDLNVDIANLVKKGLHSTIQQALDSV